MATPIIDVQGLGKKYVLRHQQQGRYTALRDVIADKVKGAFKPARTKATTSEFWALSDLNFSVNEGERVGIIGRNGAGKSTLLKVLSRITAPTTGQAIIEGRLASLLEVGTGFHPELSGRENIFLNGAILGMSRREIASKFDEIVDFAGVERFLDTPVKRYSSGMYVRLAFAVAAHLEPEVLVVDEVLSVGDAEFQRKSIAKMKEVAMAGRTLLFVSHNMAAVQNLCNRGIYLKQGRIIEQGDTADVIGAYLDDGGSMTSIDLRERKDRLGNGAIRFTRFFLSDPNGTPVAAARAGEPIVINFDFVAVNPPIIDLQVAVGIDDQYGQRITHLSNDVVGHTFPTVDGAARVSLLIPKFPFRKGGYTFTLFSRVNGEVADYMLNAGGFDVESGDFFGTGKMTADDQGTFLVDHSFSLTPLAEQ